MIPAALNIIEDSASEGTESYPDPMVLNTVPSQGLQWLQKSYT
jgi:hypothetical protein